MTSLIELGGAITDHTETEIYSRNCNESENTHDKRQKTAVIRAKCCKIVHIPKQLKTEMYSRIQLTLDVYTKKEKKYDIIRLN